jgi:hypothetical protein
MNVTACTLIENQDKPVVTDSSPVSGATLCVAPQALTQSGEIQRTASPALSGYSEREVNFPLRRR